jgi:hypothetical protein
VVKLASTISKHLKTVSETFLSCDQSTWLAKGLQQIHAAGHEAHRRAVNQSSSSLASLHPDTPRPAARGAAQPPFTTCATNVQNLRRADFGPRNRFTNRRPNRCSFRDGILDWLWAWVSQSRMAPWSGLTRPISQAWRGSGSGAVRRGQLAFRHGLELLPTEGYQHGICLVHVLPPAESRA